MLGFQRIFYLSMCRGGGGVRSAIEGHRIIFSHLTLLLYKIMFGPWNYSDLYCKSIIFENRVDLCTMYGHIVSSQT